VSPSIASLMSRPVSAVGMDDTIAQVERLLTDKGLSWAPVLEAGGAVLGVISAADLLQFHAQQRDPLSIRAWQLCTYKPLTVDQATPVAEVARAMVEQRIHHVVVTSRDGLAGVVSSLDFVRTFAEAG
jgi:signal-transduction protein with cAMP-binding, CBS, and nucleotidyltransferase domain